MKQVLLVLIGLGFIALAQAQSSDLQGLEEILADIHQLERDKDPKCYATASRLEDFMYGTPLTDQARFQKNKLQKRLARIVWSSAAETSATVGPEDVDAAFSKIITFNESEDGHNLLVFPNKIRITLSQSDVRQYGSVAYSLRAILAVQQDSLMNPDAQPLPHLSHEAIETLKTKLDLATLALLQESDAYARAHDQHKVSLENLNRAWLALFKMPEEVVVSHGSGDISPTAGRPSLLQKIIQQKITSYAQYNQISNQLFVRNMQVYFARLSWPKNEAEADAFRLGFVEALIGYAVELYKGVVKVSVANSHKLIEEQDVSRFVMHYTPFIVNEYEDVEFFPNSPKNRITIEAYDLDAFRDSGVHWLYLGHALARDEISLFLDADPFAAELLAENVAQFGVLLLRETGLLGVRTGKERLSVDLLERAVQNIQAKISASVAGANEKQADQVNIHSAVSTDDPALVNSTAWFTDISDNVRLDAMHRSSDWLNRLLRSYLRRDETTGIITIPPAFGGSGVAVGDIDNDGDPDFLILSGLGNKLYLNNGKGQFSDVTGLSGITYFRSEDSRPGEPRQPLIADLNNDGWQDIVITYVDDDHRVYMNKGDGTFEDMTVQAALGGKDLVGGPATVFDYDNDGLLDIYITYFGDYIHGVLPTLSRTNDNGLPNKLFKNIGDFRFVEVEADVADSGWGQAVSHTDFNLDNLQDLIVGNDFGSNVFYQNLGNGRFMDVSETLGVNKPSFTMNIGLADLNADEIPDIYISNIVTMNKDEKYVLPNEETKMKFNLEKLAHLRVVEANDLFMSSRSEDGQIRYSLNRELVGRGYNSTGWAWGASFFDADQDGDDDLYVLNGMNEFNLYSSKNSYADASVKSGEYLYLPVDTKESNVFFVNSNGKLNNVSEQSGLNLLGNSRSAAYLDYDDDGDLDIIINNYHQRAYFFRNNANRLQANWIKLRLVGDPSQGVNRDAIGAKVIITLSNGRKIWREIHGSEGYMTVHERVIHAGLGTLDRANVLVTWPNGKQQKIENLPANSTHLITMSSDENP